MPVLGHFQTFSHDEKPSKMIFSFANTGKVTIYFDIVVISKSQNFRRLLKPHFAYFCQQLFAFDIIDILVNFHHVP